jgi:hypothetical protein
MAIAVQQIRPVAHLPLVLGVLRRLEAASLIDDLIPPHPAQTWPRHACHQWGLKTIGLERGPDGVFGRSPRFSMLSCMTLCSLERFLLPEDDLTPSKEQASSSILSIRLPDELPAACLWHATSCLATMGTLIDPLCPA